MRKLLSLLGLLSLLSVAEASVIDSSSPWGACVRPVCWNPTGAPEGWRLEHYNAAVDSAVSLGISWVRLTGHGLLQKDDLGFNFIYEPFLQRLSAHNLNMLSQTWPNRYTNAGVTRNPDTWATARTNWTSFWDIIINHYGVDDGNGGKIKYWKITCEPSCYIGAPWRIDWQAPSTGSGLGDSSWQYHDGWSDQDYINASPKNDAVPGKVINLSWYAPIKGWNHPISGPDSITGLDGTRRAVESISEYRDLWDAVCRDARYFFYNYVRTCAKGIHTADPEAQVLGPCIGNTHEYDWRVIVREAIPGVAEAEQKIYIVWLYYDPVFKKYEETHIPPEDGWEEFLYACAADTVPESERIDIYSCHGYCPIDDPDYPGRGVQGYATVDSSVYPERPALISWAERKQKWDEFCLDKLGVTKPFWITEFGWDYIGGNPPLTQEEIRGRYEDAYTKWSNNPTFDKTKDKLFLYQLHNQGEGRDDATRDEDYFGILKNTPAPLTPTLAYNWLREFTHSHWDLFSENVSDNDWFMSDVLSATAYNNGRRLLVDGSGNLHCVFTSWHNEIMYAMSDDGGTTWKHKWVVGEGKYPVIAIDNYGDYGGINVCWVEDGKLKFCRRTLDWSTLEEIVWGAIVTVIPQTGSYSYIAPPSMDVDADNNVHIAVQFHPFPYDPGQGAPLPGYVRMGIWHCKFAISRYPDIPVETSEIDSWWGYVGGWPTSPSIALSSNSPHIAWEKDNKIYYRYRKDGVWAFPPILISDASTSSYHPCIDVYNNKVFIVWESKNPGPENDIYATHFPVGTTSGIPTGSNISGTSGFGSYAPVIVDRQILWQEITATAPNGRIFWANFDGAWHNNGDIAAMGEEDQYPVEISYVGEYYPQACVKYEDRGPLWLPKSTLHFVYTYNSGLAGSPYEIKHWSKDITRRWWEPVIRNDITWDGNVSVTGDVTILPGVTLTIEPGATIRFLGNYDDQHSGFDTARAELIVQGKLIAQGTEEKPIRFTGLDGVDGIGGQWYGIRFEGAGSDSSIIDHCVVEYGTRGISCESASPLIQNSLIRENYLPEDPNYGGGIWCNYSQATISGNTIIDNAPLPPPPPPLQTNGGQAGQELTQDIPAFSGYRQSIDMISNLSATHKTRKPVSPIKHSLSLRSKQSNVNRITSITNRLRLGKQVQSIKTPKVDNKYTWFGTGDSTNLFNSIFGRFSHRDTTPIPWSDSICWSDSIKIPDPVQYLDSLPDSTDAGIACWNSSPTITNNYLARNGNVGIYLETCSNSNVINNNVNSHCDGIGLRMSTANIIANNTANSNIGCGTVLWNSQNNMIKNNVTDSNGVFGIYLYESSNDTITGNIVNNNRAGIVLYFNSRNNIVSNNTVTYNLDWDGIYLESGDSNIIAGNNTSYNFGGLVLQSSIDNQIIGNTVSHNDGYGIDFRSSAHNIVKDNIASFNQVAGIHSLTFQSTLPSSNNIITGNTFNNNTWGILLSEDADSNTITGNTTDNNIWGIFIEQSSNNIVTGNTANNNTGADDSWGIGGRTASNNIIRDNTVSGNGTGIAFDYGSTYNTVDSNTANNNGNGIVLWEGNLNNTIEGNTTNYNNMEGILIGVSDSNTLTKNEANYNGLSGIALQFSSDSNTIENNTANYNMWFGIGIAFFSNYNNVTNNIANSNVVVGIGSYEGHNNTYINNTANNNDGGLVLEAPSPNSILRNNSMSNNVYNFHSTTGWELSHFKQDIDTTNTVNGKPIYYCQNYTNFTIPQNAGFVGLVNCDNVTVENLTLTNNGQGVLLVNTQNSTIRNNLLNSNYEAGVLLISSSRNIIEGNTANSNKTTFEGDWSFGIFLADSSNNNIIRNNTADSNQTDGIFVGSFGEFGFLTRPSDSNRIENNKCRANPRYGIWARGSGMNLINLYGNEITGSSAGVYFDAPSPALMYGRYNTITANDTGIVLMNGNADFGDLSLMGGNYIYNNTDWDLCNFTPNTVLAQGNRWCCPTSPDIDGKILDDDENALYGAVDFSNYFKWGLIPSDNVWQDVVFIGGETIIPEGNKLTINAGTVLKFASGMEPPAGLTILGELDLKGNKNNPVIFTSDAQTPQAGDWCGIIFGSQQFALSAKPIDRNANLISGNSTYQYYGNNAGVTSPSIRNANKNSSRGELLKSGDNKVKLNYVQIEYAKRGVSVFDKKLDFKNSKILNALEYGIYGKSGEYDIKDNSIEGGVYIDSTKSVDCKNNIVRDGIYGLYMRNVKTADVKKNEIRGSDYGIFASPVDDKVDIKENRISGNVYIENAKNVDFKKNMVTGGTYGLYLKDIENIDIKEDTITGNDYGLYLTGFGDGDIKNNIIRENRIGIALGGAMKTKLKENQIINNSDTGLVIRDSAKPELKKGNNAIYGSGSFDLVNNTVYTVYAEKNYWGTNNLDTIRAHIWDYYDNSTLGKVIFEPILTGWGYCGGPQVSSSEISLIPLVFKLNDIEPNPFKELTTIKYQLPRKSSVSLQVYDKTGRVVKTLVNGEKETGYYTVSWDGKEYPAGIYFVRFIAGDYKETKKLILMK